MGDKLTTEEQDFLSRFNKKNRSFKEAHDAAKQRQEATPVPPPETFQLFDNEGQGSTQMPGLLGPGMQASQQQQYLMPALYRERASKLPGAANLLKTSFVDDPMVQAKILAPELYPGVPEEEALKRFGVIKGRLVYTDPETGKLLAATPGSFIRTPVEKSIYGSSKLLPMISGTAGGILTAPAAATGPGGVMLNMAGAGTGAAIGEYMRQKIGQKIANDPMDYDQIIKEGLLDAAFQFVPAMGTMFRKRARMADLPRLERQATREITEEAAQKEAGELSSEELLQRRAQESLAPSEMASMPASQKRLYAKAKEQGIDLTPAEVTNLPSLKSQQKILTKLPETSDIMGAHIAKREKKFAENFDDFFNTISKADEGIEIAGGKGVKAAKTVGKKLAKERADLAKPLYEKAFSLPSNVDTSPVTNWIDDTMWGFPKDGTIYKGLKNAKEWVEEAGGSMRRLQGAKEEIDTMFKRASKSIGDARNSKLAALLTEAKQRLLKQMDEISPDYAKARKIYGDYSTNIGQVNEGLVGVLAKVKDTNLEDAARKMFNSKSGPKLIVNAKSQFVKAGKKNEWDQLLRSFLTDEFEKASEKAGATSSRFYEGVFKKGRMRRRLKAAMNKEQWNTFSDIMEVAEAAGRVKLPGSETAMFQRELERKTGGVQLKQMTGDVLGKMKDLFDAARIGSNPEKLAELITSTDAIRKMKQLRALKPKDIRKQAAVFELLQALFRGSVSEKPEEGSGIMAPVQEAR